MFFSQKEKVKLILSIIFLIIAGTVYLAGNMKNDKVQFFQYSENPDSLSEKLFSNWKYLPVIHGEFKPDFWENQVIIAIVFNMSDCDLCLARVHEYIMFIDSLSQNHNFGYFCVGFSKNPTLLNRYLKVLSKPCPILRGLNNQLEQSSYRFTPKIIVIDKRRNLIVAEKTIGQGNISPEILTELKIMISGIA